MFKYHIVCYLEGKEMALAAPRHEPNDGPLVIATSEDTATQRWELIGFAKADLEDNPTVDTFYLVNEATGLVAQAPHNPDGSVKGDTQEVSQADIAQDYEVVSPTRLWTLKHAGDGFAIRPHGDSGQNLNAWKGEPSDQNKVGIYAWGGGKANEVWQLKMLG